MKRKKFIQNSSKLIISSVLVSPVQQILFSKNIREEIDMPIGFQSWVLRKEINLDISKILKKTYDIGYRHVEMCSPSGYAPYSFASLTSYSGKELIGIINDTGLECKSCHFTWDELVNNLDDRINFAHQMGIKHMIASSGLNGKKLNTLKEQCNTLNRIGEKISNAGLIAGYHNHNGEFEQKKNGVPDYDIIIKELDPKYVKMQFQVAVIQEGYKAEDYFKKYPGRFLSAHLQDYSKNNIKEQVILGNNGVVDWRDFFKAAKVGGLEYVFVEMESNPGALEGSVKYLNKILN
jgi:sugar phosphate isomerase/epimerase